MATLSCAGGWGSLLRRFFAATAWSTVVAWNGWGAAEELPAVEIHWKAPSSCPGAADVEARMRRLLGPEVTRPSATRRLIAEATVVALKGHYQLRLNVQEGGHAVGGTRVFESDSCDSLAGAAAVTLALLAGGEPRPDVALPSPSSSLATDAPPSASAAPPAQARARAPDKSAPPQQRPPAPSEDTPAKGDEGPVRHWSVDVELPLLAIDEGVLPSWAYGVGASAGVRLSRLRLMLTGVLWLPQDSGAGGGSYGARYVRYNAALSGCYGWPGGQFDVGPCVVMRLEDVTARGAGPDVVVQAGHSAWLTVGVAARAAWSPRSWMALFVRPSMMFATSRPTFAITGLGPLYQVPLAAVAFDLGCEWIF